MTLDTASSRARHTLRCLDVGDAFGQRFFFMERTELMGRLTKHELPDRPWDYTDDSEMADALVSHLERSGTVQQDALASEIASAMHADRGYGDGALKVLNGISAGRSWSALTRQAFGGVGSFGNGAAMRVAPLGAWFSDQQLSAVAVEAQRSAEVTHAHPEGVAGAVAIAVATAAVYQRVDHFDSVLQHLDRGYSARVWRKLVNSPLSRPSSTRPSHWATGLAYLRPTRFHCACGSRRVGCPSTSLSGSLPQLWAIGTPPAPSSRVCSLGG